MESADQALYTAKEIGRDCSVIFSPQAADNVSGHARRRQARGEARLASLLTWRSRSMRTSTRPPSVAMRARSGASSVARRSSRT